MKENQLVIQINKSVEDLFTFTITPPHSAQWIPLIINEETNLWPIVTGTVYKLLDSQGRISKMTVSNLIENKLVEWVSENNKYHCRYIFHPVNKKSTMFEYFEWVDSGEIDNPFTLEILKKLKSIAEK